MGEFYRIEFTREKKVSLDNFDNDAETVPRQRAALERIYLRVSKTLEAIATDASSRNEFEAQDNSRIVISNCVAILPVKIKEESLPPDVSQK